MTCAASPFSARHVSKTTCRTTTWTNVTLALSVKKVSSISNDSIHDSNLTKDEVNIDETMMASQEKTSSFDDKEWVDINDVLVRPKTVCHFLPVIHFLDTILSIVTNLIKHAHVILFFSKDERFIKLVPLNSLVTVTR